MSIDTLLKDEKVYRYILDHSLKQKSAQKTLFEKARADEYSNMITAPEQVQFLALLIKMLNAKKVLEVGVFRGVGTLGMALALPEDGRLYACDITDEYLLPYKHFWQEAGIEHKIDLCVAPAIETLQKLIDEGHQGTFGFAYIDADKENYKNYYEAVYKLLKVGGVMVFDNMLWSGDVADTNCDDAATQAIRDLNDFIHHDARVEASLIPLGDGVNIVRKNIL